MAGGSYIPPTPWLSAIREKIDFQGDELLRIINSSEYRKYFNGLDGEKLKVPPRGYSKEHPHIELLKMKSFLADLSFSDKDVISEEFFEVVVSAFRTMKPLNDFLTTGIG